MDPEIIEVEQHWPRGIRVDIGGCSDHSDDPISDPGLVIKVR